MINSRYQELEAERKVRGVKKMKDVLENKEVKDILYGLAVKIRNMTEEEKLSCLKNIDRAELSGSINRFWITVAKRMLVSDCLPCTILLEEEWPHLNIL